MSLPNLYRNKEIYNKRNKNPKKWTWGELGEFYHIKRQTAYKAYKAYKRYLTADK